MVWGPQHLSLNSAAAWCPASRPCLQALSKPLPGMTHGATRIHQARNRKTGQRRSATLVLPATVKLRCCARAAAPREAAFPERPHGKDRRTETRRWLAIRGRLSSEGAAKGSSCQWMRNTSETRDLYRPHTPSTCLSQGFLLSQNSSEEPFRENQIPLRQHPDLTGRSASVSTLPASKGICPGTDTHAGSRGSPPARRQTPKPMPSPHSGSSQQPAACRPTVPKDIINRNVS